MPRKPVGGVPPLPNPCPTAHGSGPAAVRRKTSIRERKMKFTIDSIKRAAFALAFSAALLFGSAAVTYAHDGNDQRGRRAGRHQQRERRQVREHQRREVRALRRHQREDHDFDNRRDLREHFRREREALRRHQRREDGRLRRHQRNERRDDRRHDDDHDHDHRR
jgi:hypothetical protein